MSDHQEILTSVLTELKHAQTFVTRHKARQITNADGRDLLKSVAYAWFRSHRSNLRPGAGPDLTPVDLPFQVIIEATDRASTKATYLAAIKEATAQVRPLRTSYLVPASSPPSSELLRLTLRLGSLCL